jgi:hypothetical protein
MLKNLLSAFYPVSCSRYSNQDLAAGDLLFYRAYFITTHITDFIGGVSAVSSESIYHIAMVVKSHEDNITIIHALPEKGVVANCYKNICDAESVLNEIKVYRVDTTLETINKAVEIATQHIGKAYNDKFSPDFINSKGEHSYYCSQLIQDVYNKASACEIFPSHPMGFPYQDGKVSAYWVQYFEKLNVEVPIGVNGSHPGIIYDSDFLIDII